MSFRDDLKERLKDPDFASEYKALEPEYEIIRQIILTQKHFPNCHLTGR